MESRIKEPFIARLAGALSNVKTLELRPWVSNLLTFLMQLPSAMNKGIQLIQSRSFYIKHPLLQWLAKIWGMAPKLKERESDDGRDAEDKSQHKGDWGSHSHADKVAEEMEPTEEQLKQAQAAINSQWIQPEC